MSCVSVARAILVRLLFAVHGLVAVWLLVTITRENHYWYIAAALGLLLFEMTVTLGKKGGKEWKWFCPSVFIYLMCVVPAIWFLELHEMNKRIERRRTILRSCSENETMGGEEELSASLGTVLGVNLEIRIPLRLKAEMWIKMLEQMLLLLLILGRWLLPKGKLTHDQLSQLLLVYIGTAADIVEFFDTFKEKVVMFEPHLCMAILGIWSFSLIQFSLVLTATRARRDQSGLVPTRRSRDPSTKGVGCCSADVYGIIISIMLQDAPFLVLRLLLIFKYNVVSYTNIFFTSKNTIVIVLLIYRLIVVHIEKKREQEEDIEASSMLKEQRRRLAECGSFTPSSYSGKARLVKSGSSYSNGFYAPTSRCTTPHRDDTSCGSMGSITLVGGADGGGGGGPGAMRRGTVGGGGGRLNRTYNVDTLNSPV